MQEETGTTGVAIYLTLHGDVRRLRPKHAPDRAPVMVPASTVAGLIRLLNLPPKEPLIAAVNGEAVPRSTALHEGDEVLLTSPMESG